MRKNVSFFFADNKKFTNYEISQSWLKWTKIIRKILRVKLTDDAQTSEKISKFSSISSFLAEKNHFWPKKIIFVRKKSFLWEKIFWAKNFFGRKNHFWEKKYFLAEKTLAENFSRIDRQNLLKNVVRQKISLIYGTAKGPIYLPRRRVPWRISPFFSCKISLLIYLFYFLNIYIKYYLVINQYPSRAGSPLFDGSDFNP